MGPTLRGELLWCQLFSEPGAGSDLAALSTRATRVEGGWRLDGQKVWTSVAARADMGICLARTNPDVPKHRGITYFLVDMKSPGIEVRPLREITGAELFNEVFLDGCFVPDDCVVGEIDGGLAAGPHHAGQRAGLALLGLGLRRRPRRRAGPDRRPPRAPGPGHSRPAGSTCWPKAQSWPSWACGPPSVRSGGLQPGSESSLRKLLGAEFEQRVHEFGLDLCGPDGVFTEGEAAVSAHGVLQSKCLTIAGGTSEVQRNVIGERLLGLPRDPEPGR